VIHVFIIRPENIRPPHAASVAPAWRGAGRSSAGSR
jgi:hypothetical protein